MTAIPTGHSGQSNPQPKLKPCPFCGKDVELKHYKANGDDWWYIACRHCGIAVDPWMWNAHQTREDAIEKWNRRVRD